MDFPIIDTVKALLNQRLADLEAALNGDVLTYFGPIQDGTESSFLQVVEQLASDQDKKDALFIVLTTPGGSAIAVERMVNIVRNHYSEVNFVVPDFAYSAGTIFCMSGDNILMDYYSVLGPIDPQVRNKEGKFVPALGYLDKVKELVEKAQNGTLSQAEFIILKELDLAELRAFEQAKELTIDQLKNWLVKYKFKKWTHHKSDPNRVVTADEKLTRAEEIAAKLSDNNRWKSHGRPINIETLEKELKLKIENYGDSQAKKECIRKYHMLVSDYAKQNNLGILVHTRRFL